MSSVLQNTHACPIPSMGVPRCHSGLQLHNEQLCTCCALPSRKNSTANPAADSAGYQVTLATRAANSATLCCSAAAATLRVAVTAAAAAAACRVFLTAYRAQLTMKHAPGIKQASSAVALLPTTTLLLRHSC
jgi:hypothetical protein